MSLSTYYQKYIALGRYSRFDDDKGRREIWPETVNRWKTFWQEEYPEHSEFFENASEKIENTEVMPSMRTLMTAGEALRRDNVAAYNCAYSPMESPQDLAELFYILLCGTGEGYSVERRYISYKDTDWPVVPKKLRRDDDVITVSDSKLGWATSFRELLTFLYAGVVPSWDVSRVRPRGARLKTFGGRASGPEPLERLFRFTVNIFLGAKGRKLKSIEVHDLCCMVADIVVVGGVRRSAMISLSDLDDEDMASAKSFGWWDHSLHRALANNSAVYDGKPERDRFDKEWNNLVASMSGERGIVNREALKRQASKNGRRDTGYDFGTNPCSEIILRPRQFCNLTEIVVRPTDDLESLREKAYFAAAIGTFQSTLTNFRFLREEWKRNSEEERLLGVSLTGEMDHPVLGPKGDKHLRRHWLFTLKETAIEANREWADKLGINRSTAITCVKPSGTVSQLVDSASGMHSRYSTYYIRRVRGDRKDPLTQFCIDKGIPWEPAVGKEDDTVVFSFPMKSPDGSVTRKEIDAISHLELWLEYQDYWCEHKPSITVSVKEDEWDEVREWVYEHFDKISGISFLPFNDNDHAYVQAPYEEVNEQDYNRLVERMPEGIDWKELVWYETTDHTTSSQEYACTGGACEIV